MTRLTRRERFAAGFWILLSFVAWNALYDLWIRLGVREYLLQAALHEAGRGPAVVMSEAMRATVHDAVFVASLWGVILLVAGLGTVYFLRSVR